MYWGKFAGSIGGETAVAERAGRQSLRAPDEAAPAGRSAAAASSTPIKRVTSSSLFQGGRLVLIEHAGSEYRLQITSRGKLILTR